MRKHDAVASETIIEGRPISPPAGKLVSTWPITPSSGTIDPTIIRSNAKIDDQVFIAHNCDIGENTLIIAQSEISGSVRVGRDVWIGPSTTTLQGVAIGDNSFLGACTLVTKSLPSGGVYAGTPARLLRPRTTE